MHWCCGPIEAVGPEVVSVETKDTDTIPTNSPKEDPAKTGDDASERGASVHSIGNRNEIDEEEDLISVTVPKGVGPGQTMTVLTPDGSRTVRASVPATLKAGDSFLIRLAKPLPPHAKAPASPKPGEGQPEFAKSIDAWMSPNDAPKSGPEPPDFAKTLDAWLTPAPGNTCWKASSPQQTASIPNETKNSESAEEGTTGPPSPEHPHQIGRREENLTARSARSKKVNGETPSAQKTDNYISSPKHHDHHEQSGAIRSSRVKKVVGEPVNAAIEKADTRQENDTTTHSMTDSYYHDNASARQPPTSHYYENYSSMQPPPISPTKQKLLMVHVPEGVPAGATLQVEIPGEDRTLAAQVPPGVRTFHVAYTPRTFHGNRSFDSRTQGSSKISLGQKLLLVRVPPGTVPGTTLHVSVPDEPGRILAAQVPPGGVQEFHVSYEARPPRHPKNHLMTRNESYRDETSASYTGGSSSVPPSYAGEPPRSGRQGSSPEHFNFVGQQGGPIVNRSHPNFEDFGRDM